VLSNYLDNGGDSGLVGASIGRIILISRITSAAVALGDNK
jgi:hypothetical protein